MSYLLPIYSIFFLVLALALVLKVLSHSDETSQRKFARVRVWVDDNRKQRIPPPDDDLNSETGYEWLLVGGALLLLLILLKAAN
jgi:hypothetical protein